MTNKPDDDHDPMRPGGSFRRPTAADLLELFPDQLEIRPKAQESTRYRCGTAEVVPQIGGKKSTPEEIARLTQPCYEMPAGGTTVLTIGFLSHGKRVKPKGVLRITTDRGKLSPTSVELRGDAETVPVKYTAPDETIKVSIRAFLDGFRRAKVHLHLE